MLDDIRKAAVSAILNIFETMFFTLLEPFGDDPAAVEEGTDKTPPASFLKSEISFEGYYCGHLYLWLPYDLGEMLTQNFMGFEEEVTESQILDMTGELANMICGNLFSVLDKNSVYNLGAPVTQKVASLNGMEPAKETIITMKFMAEDQPIAVQIQLKSKTS